MQNRKKEYICSRRQGETGNKKYERLRLGRSPLRIMVTLNGRISPSSVI
jgi:hypothetical protein